MPVDYVCEYCGHAGRVPDVTLQHFRPSGCIAAGRRSLGGSAGLLAHGPFGLL